MSTEASSPLRIVISLDAAEQRDYAVELARWLVPAQSLELLGLFIEDEALLAHARSRWSREILATGSERALDHGAVERQIRLQAARAKARFEAATTRLGLRHRFATARGDVLIEPIRHAAGAQALVVGVAQAPIAGISGRNFIRQLAAGPPLVLLARQGWLRGKSVAVIINDGDDLLLDAAARIARQTHSPLIALVADAESAGGHIQPEQIAAKLRGLGIEKFRTISLSHPNANDVIAATRTCSARLLVMQSPAPTEESPIFEELLRRFSGALMFVRSHRNPG